MYSDNTTYKYRDSYRTASPRKFYADFNDTDRFDATIYQQTGSDGGGRTYITGSKASGSLGMTVEADIIFPRSATRSCLFPHLDPTDVMNRKNWN